MLDCGVKKICNESLYKNKNKEDDDHWLDHELLEERSEDLDDLGYLERERMRFKRDTVDSKVKTVFFNKDKNVEDVQLFQQSSKKEGFKEFVKCGRILSKINTLNQINYNIDNEDECKKPGYFIGKKNEDIHP